MTIARGWALVDGLRAFVGDWRVTRRIDDVRAGVEGRFTGVASFHPEEEELICREQGMLVYAGQPPLEATRLYRWRAEGADRIAVDYADGRPFHSFPLDPHAQAEHHCAPDLYRVVYDFSAWPVWRATWTVSGPRKSYVSMSEYRRLGG